MLIRFVIVVAQKGISRGSFLLYFIFHLNSILRSVSWKWGASLCSECLLFCVSSVCCVSGRFPVSPREGEIFTYRGGKTLRVFLDYPVGGLRKTFIYFLFIILFLSPRGTPATLRKLIAAAHGNRKYDAIDRGICFSFSRLFHVLRAHELMRE